VLQVVNILVLLTIYAGVVCGQLTLGERVLREEDGCIGVGLRVVLSVVHGAFGYGILLGVVCLLGVILFGDYRRGFEPGYSRLMPVVGGLFGLSVPWLPLLSGRRGQQGNSRTRAGDAPQDDRDDPRPWEQPGAVRRDVAPHRGHWLRALGVTAVVCGLLSVCLGLPALVALPLGGILWVVARRDLARMDAGLLDPAGRGETEQARDQAVLGLMIGVPGAMIWLLLLAALSR
jgi:hypothetical protein